MHMTHSCALTMLEQALSMHLCFLVPGPPNLTLSLQLRHWPQSSLRHPGQAPHPCARRLRDAPAFSRVSPPLSARTAAPPAAPAVAMSIICTRFISISAMLKKRPPCGRTQAVTLMTCTSPSLLLGLHVIRVHYSACYPRSPTFCARRRQTFKCLPPTNNDLVL